MKKKANAYKKKILDAIGMTIITITICIFSVIVGANEKGLRTLPMCILLFIALAYLIARKITLKQQIVIKNKIDIFVLLFMSVTLLPLIFKTYCTLQGTIEFIIKYFFVYAMYLVVRNTIDSKRKIEVLTTITIISSLFVIILGLDLQHEQYLKEIIKKLNLNYSADTRFSSTFGYANTVAIYITFCIFLAVHNVQNAESKIVKALNIIYVLLGFYIVYITVSRAVLLLLIAGLLLYFAIYYYNYYKSILKDKKKLIICGCALVAIITITICMLTVGLKYSKTLEIGNYYEDVLRYSFEANKEYEIKLDINTVNNEKNNENNKENNAENNKENNEENNDKDNNQNKTQEQNKSEIKIIEENIYRNKTTLESEQIENFNGIKTLKITPDSYLLRIIIEISNKDNEKIIINKCYINNEENILNYKYIPNQIARLLKSFSLKEGSINQRLDFYKDCLKIAQNNWIIGQGGNTWKKLSLAVQEYPYTIKETHSYFFELLISYGIVGIILFLTVFIGLNIKLIQEYKYNNNIGNSKSNLNIDDNGIKQSNNKYKMSILFGLDILILHSFFDFNMSFLIINLLVFMYIAVLMYNSENTLNNNNYNITKEINLKKDYLKEKKINLYKKEKTANAKCKYTKTIDYIVFTFLATILVVLIFASIAQYCVEDKTTKKNLLPYNYKYRYDYINSKMRETQDFDKTISEIQKLMKNEPYYNQNELSDKYWNLILRNTMKIKSEQLAEYLKFINHQYKTAKIATPMKINSVISRAKTMANAYVELKEMNYSDEEILKQIEELKQIIKDEYKTNIINIKAKERNGLEQEKIDKTMAEYNEILEKIEE